MAVKIIITADLKTPVEVKNITPCKAPNKILCIVFASGNRSLFCNRFSKNPLKSISSGKAVLRKAYTNAAGIALTPISEKSDVAVFVPLIRYRTKIEININPAVPSNVISNAEALCPDFIFLNPIHEKKLSFD